MFIEIDLETVLSYMNKLQANDQPKWGSMSAQRMIEHLTDTLRIANGKNPQTLLVPEEKLEGMLRFLESDKPMPRDMEVPFAPKNVKLRNEELELAIDEFVDEWLEFESLFGEGSTRTELHPYYGQINYEQWLRLHQKHLTHHFEQFGLLDK